MTKAIKCDGNSAEGWLSFLGGDIREAQDLLHDIRLFIKVMGHADAKEFLGKCDRMYHCINATMFHARQAVSYEKADGLNELKENSKMLVGALVEAEKGQQTSAEAGYKAGRKNK